MSYLIETIQEFKQDDVIIAFMGPTGAGKSYFIDLLTDEEGKRSGHSLTSVTAKVEATRIPHPKTRTPNIVLVDTPGFDDTYRSDLEVLTMISEWLAKTYKKDIKLSGLVYLHAITDSRITGATYKNLRMFGNICGDSATSRVVLVSTKWEDVRNMNIAEQREDHLIGEFWKPFIENGSHVERLSRSEGTEAWRIVDDLIRRHKKREVLLLQEELVDLERHLNETEAGKTLFTAMQRHLSEQKDSLDSLVNKIRKTGDPRLRGELEDELNKIRSPVQETFNAMSKLEVPLSRRIRVFFSGKKTHAKAIKIRENTK